MCNCTILFWGIIIYGNYILTTFKYELYTYIKKSNLWLNNVNVTDFIYVYRAMDNARI